MGGILVLGIAYSEGGGSCYRGREKEGYLWCWTYFLPILIVDFTEVFDAVIQQWIVGFVLLGLLWSERLYQVPGGQRLNAFRLVMIGLVLEAVPAASFIMETHPALAGIMLVAAFVVFILMMAANIQLARVADSFKYGYHYDWATGVSARIEPSSAIIV